MDKQKIGQKVLENKKPCELQDQRGSVAVEFALILPILTVLLFGVIDFGRMLWFKEVLVNATRDGARMATLYDSGNNEAAIRDRIALSLQNGGLTPSNLVVSAPGNPETMVNGQAVTVNTQIDWDYLVIDKLLPHGLTSSTLQAQITMVHE